MSIRVLDPSTLGENFLSCMKTMFKRPEKPTTTVLSAEEKKNLPILLKNVHGFFLELYSEAKAADLDKVLMCTFPEKGFGVDKPFSEKFVFPTSGKIAIRNARESYDSMRNRASKKKPCPKCRKAMLEYFVCKSPNKQLSLRFYANGVNPWHNSVVEVSLYQVFLNKYQKNAMRKFVSKNVGILKTEKRPSNFWAGVRQRFTLGNT